MFFNPLGIPFASTAGNGVQGQDACSLLYTDISGDFSGDWSTANSSIATVDYDGTHMVYIQVLLPHHDAPLPGRRQHQTNNYWPKRSLVV